TPHTNPKNLANSPRRKVDPTASLAAAHLPPSLTNPLTNRIECGPNPGQMLCPAGNSQSGASAITFRRFVVLRLEAIGMMIYRLGGQEVCRIMDPKHPTKLLAVLTEALLALGKNLIVAVESRAA